MYYPEKYFPSSRAAYGRLRAYILSRGQFGKSTAIYGLQRKNAVSNKILLGENKGDMIYVFRLLLTNHFAAIPETLFFKRVPVQFKQKAAGHQPSLKFLASLPQNHPYENVGMWLVTRKRLLRGRGCRIATKEFIADRIQAAKYSYLYSKYILGSSALPFGKKLRLLFWVFYAYLRSLRYGHV